MKSMFSVIVFLFCIFLQHCNTIDSNGYVGIPGDDSKISDSLKTVLKEDAAVLALRNIQENPEKKESLVVLPTELVDSYYNGLVCIYNDIYLYERDLIIDKYKIHAFRSPETHELIVSVDSTKDWVNAWKNGQRLTGNPQIDFLMESYNLQLLDYYFFP